MFRIYADNVKMMGMPRDYVKYSHGLTLSHPKRVLSE